MNRTAFNRGAATFLAYPVILGATLANGSSVVAIEKRWGGVVGIAAHDLRNDSRLYYRAEERFPLASTQKLPLVMAVLARVARGKLSLEQRITFSREDLEDYSKIAEDYPQGGSLTLRDLCQLTISFSDNTAADLLSPMVGGPSAVTRFLHSIGINNMRVDRLERDLPTLDAARNEPRDTTTPLAMLELLTRLVSNSPLPSAETFMLMTWLRQNEIGKQRLRAGVPEEWAVADKTGSYQNASNDVGFLFPPQGRPIVVAVYAFGQPGDLNGTHAIAACARSLTMR